jgi:glycosyltransferase involved in cell wall biosynthesis
MSAQCSLAQARVAVVHDWLDTWRGGESALAEVLAVLPQADLFALVDFLPPEQRPRLLGKHAHVSFIQRFPGAARHFRAFLPLFPRAVESLDVAGYDLVVSVSHAVAKGVRTHARQLHLCYCLTPMRYAWDLRETYLVSARAERGIRRRLADDILDRLQRWDMAATSRVDRFIAISEYIRERIHRCYHRDAVVIHPPVDTEFFTPGAQPARAIYVTASHWVPYKRLDLIVDAFRGLPNHRLIIAGDLRDSASDRDMGARNVEFVGEVPRERLRELMREARAFVFTAEEDFGIAPLEAQACGTPVIAFSGGGAAETIRGLDSDVPTGVFFPAQTAAAIRSAVNAFEQNSTRISSDACRANALRFSPAMFRERFAAYVNAAFDDSRVARRESRTC